MSTELETVKQLAAKAQGAQPWDLKPILLALIAAIINWMEKHEEQHHGNEKNHTS